MVEVIGNNIDGALHLLKKALEKDGIFRSIKRRSEYPNLTDRRRQKDLLAAKRRLRLQKRKAMNLRNRRESVYNQEIRKQDRGIRTFNLRHSLTGVK